MKKKVLAGIMTTAMIMAMMTGCGSSDTAKDTQASTRSETSADSSAAESDYTIGISQFAEHGSLDNCREGFLEGLKSAGIESRCQSDSRIPEFTGRYRNRKYNR